MSALTDQIFAASKSVEAAVSSSGSPTESAPASDSAEAAGPEVFYVSLSGDDANPGTEDSPFGTIPGALRNLGPGDTLFIRGGTWFVGVHSSRDGVPSGTSFGNAVTIGAYPGETVVLQPVTGTAVLQFASPVRFTIWRNLVFDGALLTSPSAIGLDLRQAADHNRFVNLEVRNMNGSGVYLAADSGNTDNEFIGMNVHHVALGFDGLGDGIHIASSGNLVDGGQWHHVNGTAGNSAGIRIYSEDAGADGNLVRNVTVYQNQFGIFFGSGDQNVVSNSLFYDNLNVAAQIGGPGASDQNSFFNNTVVGNRGPAMGVGATMTHSRVVNNIFWKNDVDVVADSGIGSVVASNLASDPHFQDEQARDLHLTAMSVAVDAGLTVAEVRDDKDGISRPQGSGVDVGAYEYPVPSDD